MGSGYPSFLAISLKKNAFTFMKSAFTEDNLQIFSKNAITGGEKYKAIKMNLPKLNT